MNAFRNALKIVGKKFSVVWVILLYILITSVLLISLNLSVLLPYIRASLDFDLAGRLSETLRALGDGEGIGVFFSNLYALAGDFLAEFTRRRFASYALVVALVVVSRFIFGLAELAFHDIINAYCAEGARASFRACFVRRLLQGTVFQLNKVLFTLPFDVGILGASFGIVSLSSRFPVVAVLAPFLISLIFIVLFSLRLALFSGWAPALCGGDGVYPALRKHFAELKENFWAVYSIYLVYTVASLAFNLLFGVFTLGAGFVITLPLTMLFLTVLNCTVRYRNAGSKYYVDADTETIANNIP